MRILGISGYLEKTDCCNPKNYLHNVIFTLVVPYFIWNVICIIFHYPLTLNNICSVVVGRSLWNAASWFLGVLVIIKLVGLLLRNHKFLIATITTTFLFIIFLIDYQMPFFANLAFMFMPFYFIGMYNKHIINKIVLYFENRHFINIILFITGIILLYVFYKNTNIPHTAAVTSFTKHFFLYWVTGLLGIASMFFLCITFNKQPCGFIQAISISTLFIMCSHFEILQLITRYITSNHGDIYSILFVVVFFFLQCLCIPAILKYFPILAGRKKHK